MFDLEMVGILLLEGHFLQRGCLSDTWMEEPEMDLVKVGAGDGNW